jgi:hypothetical protein
MSPKCRFRTHAPQQTTPSLDHVVGAQAAAAPPMSMMNSRRLTLEASETSSRGIGAVYRKTQGKVPGTGLKSF